MNLEPILEEREAKIVHRAGWVLADGDTVIQNGFVRVENGVIRETGSFHSSCHDRVVDHGEGLLMPAFVNAHTHLELSALKGQLAFGGRFSDWVRDLLKHRESLGFDGLVRSIGQGLDELLYGGTLVVGDVSTLGIVSPHVRNSALSGILFREYLGNDLPDLTHNPDSGRFVRSFAGHAPHTASPGLLTFLKKSCTDLGRPLSIHLAESVDEFEFITTGKGAWADFLGERGVDYSDWGLPFESPVAYLDSLGLLGSGTLAVHLIHAGKKDIGIMKQRGAWVCLCLRSNRNLHNTLPDVDTLVREQVRLCLGTDSLASTESLGMVDEMRFLARAFPAVALKEIFRMATLNGAEALGLGHAFGSLRPGKRAAMVYAPVRAYSEKTLLEKLLS